MTRERAFGWVGSISLQLLALSALGVSPYLDYRDLPEPRSAIPPPRFVSVIETPKAHVARQRAPRASAGPRNPAPPRSGFFATSVIPIEIPPETGLFEQADDGGPFGVLVGIPDSAGSDPLARDTEAPPTGPIRVGGRVTAPRKLRHVSPVYPAIAAAARVQGTVSLEATIDERGNVVDLRVLVSIPLLDGAALEAVRQWKYEPTLLNGSPVPILMTVSVKFELGR
jgi:protein TonB